MNTVVLLMVFHGFFLVIDQPNSLMSWVYKADAH